MEGEGDMTRIYSTYEAKARFSEILRRVREGTSVQISYRGKPVAEIRPLDPDPTLASRLDELRARGVVVSAGGSEVRPARVARRPGALERFLTERDE